MAKVHSGGGYGKTREPVDFPDANVLLMALLHRTGRLLAPLVALAVLLGMLAPAAEAAADRPVTVLIGVGGLRPTDLDSGLSPTLWDIAGTAAAGSIAVRTASPRTCPLDAWLTLSAGRKAFGPSPEQSDDGADQETPAADPVPRCQPLPTVQADGSVTGWQELVELQETAVGENQPGLLGSRLAEAGVCANAVGPGAALALATEEGRVARYSAQASQADFTACPVSVVDGGDLLSTSAESAVSLPRFDRLVNEVSGYVPEGSRIIVAGIADPKTNPPGLQVVLQWDVGQPTPYWLTSASARRTGIVQLTDLTATLLSRAGASITGIDGKPLELDTLRRTSTSGTIRALVDSATLGSIVPAVVPWFGGFLVGGQLAVYGAGALGRRRSQAPRRKTRWRKVMLGVAIGASCAPVATYLTSLTEWWTTSMPALALAGWGLGFTAALAAVAYLLAGRRLWGVAAAVGGITMAVLTVDGLLGTPMQYGSLLVAGPALGGRFYGFNNATFAVYATSMLLAAGAAGSALLARGRRRLAVAAVLVLGALAVMIDGWPSFGADFGGVLAMIPAVAVLAFAVSGRKVTLVRLAIAAGVAVVVVAAIATLDWLRPPGARSHLGEFVASVLAGDAFGIVLSKAQSSLSTLLFPFAGPFAVVTFALAGIAVWRPQKLRFGLLQSAFDRIPLLRPTLVSIIVMSLIGTFVNDTGVVVAGMALLLTVPVMVATCLRLPEMDVRDRPPG